MVMLLSMLAEAKTEDLPETPWPLKGTRDTEINGQFVPAAHYVMVNDNSKLLCALRRDAAAGPRGPRFRTGALEEDLEAISYALSEREGNQQ